MRIRRWSQRALWSPSFAMLAMSAASAATITRLTSEADYLSGNVIVDPFDSPLGTAREYAFDPTAVLIASNDNQLARSGVTFLGDNDKPLTVTFSVEAYEVGAYMGNDDDSALRFGSIFFGQVDFFLDAYDTAGNDLIDQLVGLRSDVALGSVVFRNTSEFFNPGLVLDDFAVGFETSGIAVPGPGTLGLLAPAGFGLLLLARRRANGR